MKLDWVKFQTAYDNSQPQIQGLIDSETISGRVESVIAKYNLTVPKNDLVVCAVNRILNLESDTDLILFLTGYNLSSGQAVTVLNEVSHYETAAGPINTPPYIAPEIAKTEAAPETVSPLRTMATDGAQVGYQSADEPVYTSVQSALLNESKQD